MKALTIHEPWASLIVCGIKDVENRSRLTHFRGPLAIHASGRPLRDQDMARAFAILKQVGAGLPQPFPLHGQVLGVVEVTGCVTESESPWFTGPQGWTVLPLYRLSPLKCKGRQFLWNLPEEIGIQCLRPGWDEINKRRLLLLAKRSEGISKEEADELRYLGELAGELREYLSSPSLGELKSIEADLKAKGQWENWQPGEKCTVNGEAAVVDFIDERTRKASVRVGNRRRTVRLGALRPAKD